MLDMFSICRIFLSSILSLDKTIVFCIFSQNLNPFCAPSSILPRNSFESKGMNQSSAEWVLLLLEPTFRLFLFKAVDEFSVTCLLLRPLRVGVSYIFCCFTDLFLGFFTMLRDLFFSWLSIQLRSSVCLNPRFRSFWLYFLNSCPSDAKMLVDSLASHYLCSFALLKY